MRLNFLSPHPKWLPNSCLSAASLARNHPAECAVVLSLFPELPEFRREDGRTRSRSGSLDDSPMGETNDGLAVV